MFSRGRFWIVRGMRRRSNPARQCAGLPLLLAVAACGSSSTFDPNNREVPWTYGPLTGGATEVHLSGAGKKGEPVAKGWQCRLVQQKRLTVAPYQLAAAHPLFGKAMLSIGLFDRAGNRIETLRTTPLAAGGGAFSFELAEATAKALNDVVIWYVEP